MMVVSIALVVGIDGGSNSQFRTVPYQTVPGIDSTPAESGRSVYFFRSYACALLPELLCLQGSPSRKFFMWTSILGILCLAAILLIHSPVIAWGLVFMIGLAVCQYLPFGFFSITVEKYPAQTNEISGLMMMAISGGAVIPLPIGWISDLSNVSLGMSILIACMHLPVISLYLQI